MIIIIVFFYYVLVSILLNFILKLNSVKLDYNLYHRLKT